MKYLYWFAIFAFVGSPLSAAPTDDDKAKKKSEVLRRQQSQRGMSIGERKKSGEKDEDPVPAELNGVLVRLDVNGEAKSFLIELDAEYAPKHVENFKKLVSENYYKGHAFHRVIRNYLIQIGDPLSKDDSNRDEWGTGGPGYTIPGEFDIPHQIGAIAMARLGDKANPSRESSGSQFYISLGDLSSLDGKYSVFGQVTQGLTVLKEISRMLADTNDAPVQRVELRSAKLVDPEKTVVDNSGRRKKDKYRTRPDSQKGPFEKFIEQIW